jgi:hypothetical protein
MKLKSCLFIIILSQQMMAQTQRNVGTFSAVSTAGDLRVELIKSSTPKVEITMLKGKESDVITTVSGGELTIKVKHGYFFNTNASAKVKVYYSSIQEIGASAGSLVSSKETIASPSLDVQSSSGATINLSVNADKIKVQSSSGSRITLYGQADNGDFHSSSGSSIIANDLNTKNASAHSASGSSMSIWPTDELVADASSGGSIRYKGKPTTKAVNETSSGGSVQQY